jgi:gamma-glutamylcyclotransferase (GGCT)/AIG2-like uncharacterized protein YtfP
MKKKLFAYGSMKKGFMNEWRLKAQIFIGNATTVEKYTMHPSESFRFPYAVEKIQEYLLHGELYEINDELWDTIDLFEGTPKHYYRKEIEATCKGEKHKAYIYFRSENNPHPCAYDIHTHTWTKEFEKAGALLEAFNDQLILAKLESTPEEKMDTIEDDLKHLDNLFKNALGKIK